MNVGTINDLKITILCDNVISNLHGVGEHGFAAFIETERGNYLFDTGSGLGIMENARIFKKDVGSINALFLSHGHYDHTGGLPQVVEAAGPLDVYGHPAIFDKKFTVSSVDGQDIRRFIGMPHRRFMIESKGASFRLDRQFQEVAEGIYLTGEIPRLTPFETVDPKFAVKRGDLFSHDAVVDDQALVFSTAKGVVVLLGCAHSGIINTLSHVSAMLGTETFFAVIGGTHLGFCSTGQLEESIEALKRLNIGQIGLCHCTGIDAFFRLRNELGNRCFYASVGTSIGTE